MGGQVGTIFARALHRMGIRYETSDRCNCYACMTELNGQTPDQIEENIDYWEGRVQESANEWFHSKMEDGKYMVQALKPVARQGIKPLLLWSCHQARGN